MKARKWSIEGTAIGGDESKPMTFYTSATAGREVAWGKLCHKIPENLRCFVRLKKGKVVDI